MASSTMRATMIRVAVTKGIRDIRENAGRGIRNLAELGKMFAKGRNQTDFFDKVMAVLRDENNAYYKLVGNMVSTVEEDNLATFGINLGYNSLSNGANVIRRNEEELGFNIPWCIGVGVGTGGTEALYQLDRVISEGRELGVFAYPLALEEGYAGFEDLARLMGKYSDCAFILFVPPSLVTQEVCGLLQRARNAAVLLNVDGENGAVAADLLARAGCLRGGYQMLEDAAAPVDERLLATCENMSLPVCVWLRGKAATAPLGDATYRDIVRLRENLSVPVLPLDWYQDVAYADRVVSTEACFVQVEPGGALIARDAETGRTTRCDLRIMSLREALRQALPKAKAGAGFAPA